VTANVLSFVDIMSGTAETNVVLLAVEVAKTIIVRGFVGTSAPMYRCADPYERATVAAITFVVVSMGKN
jgi:hypothetical protein